ncbi:MAG: PucR family transcriptional regulator [Micromonosporaceae bacterium]|nr:PucR family transcriptional regulator [Micromonosporaceae bacterium]
MYPSVSEVLALPVVRAAGAKVVAGSAGLERRVRWVHVAEVADIAELLRGGELVLTTGIALPDDPDALTGYIDALARVGAAGLVVELVRRWHDDLPTALTAAADRHGLPLITFSKETRYVTVSEAVISMIMDAQVAELRAAQQVHETFTALTVSGAEPAVILREVARMSGRPVVLETLAHHVLAYDSAGESPAELLADWEHRSRAAILPGRTAYHRGVGWLATTVGARGDDWGRLIIVTPEEPTRSQVVVAERAADALALNRLVARDRDSLERQTHRSLLAALLGPGPAPADLAASSAALGVPLQGHQLIGMAARPHPVPSDRPALGTQEVLRDLAEVTALAARRSLIPALVGVVDDVSVRALLALPARADVASGLRRVAKEVHAAAATAPGPLRGLPVVLAAGSVIPAGPDAVPAAGRSLREAAHVARAVPSSPDDAEPAVHRLADVRLRGLLHLLRGDERLTAYVERELGPLLSSRTPQSERLLEVLRGFCEHGGNKSAAAAAAHTSRTAYYQQIARLEQVLGVRLDDPESVLSLHVALLASEAQRPGH